MKKTKKIFLLSVVSFLIGAMLLLAQYFLATKREAEVAFLNRNLVLKTELAINDKQRARGLMERKKMDLDRGMLFVFNDEDFLSFWMKNTFIPLDLVFISSDFKIVDIKKDFQPCPPQESCLSYTSSFPARYVVEMNAGLATEKGLEKGDKILIKIK